MLPFTPAGGAAENLRLGVIGKVDEVAFVVDDLCACDVILGDFEYDLLVVCGEEREDVICLDEASVSPVGVIDLSINEEDIGVDGSLLEVLGGIGCVESGSDEQEAAVDEHVQADYERLMSKLLEKSMLALGRFAGELPDVALCEYDAKKKEAACEERHATSGDELAGNACFANA